MRVRRFANRAVGWLKMNLTVGLLWAAFILHSLMWIQYESSSCFLFRGATGCLVNNAFAVLAVIHFLTRIVIFFVLHCWLFFVYSFCLPVVQQFNPLKPELNPVYYLLALLAHHFLHVSRIRVKSLTFRRLMSYIYGAPILDVSRSHTTTQHSR